MIYINKDSYPGPQIYKHPDQDASPAMKELMGKVKRTLTNFSWPPEDLRWLKTAMKWPCSSPFLVRYDARMQKWKDVLKKHEDGTVVELRKEVAQLTTFIEFMEEKLKNYAACTPIQDVLENDIGSAKSRYIKIVSSSQRGRYLASRQELKDTLATLPQVIVITDSERAYLNRRHYANDFVVESGCREYNSMTQQTIDLIDEMQNLWRTRNQLEAHAKARLNKMYYTQDNYGVVPYDSTVKYFAKDYLKLNLKEEEQDQPQKEAENELFFQPLTPTPTQVDWLDTSAHLLGLFLVQKRREELDEGHPSCSPDEKAQYEFVESLKLGQQSVVNAEKELISSAVTMLVSVNKFLDGYKEILTGYRDKETRINAQNATDPKRQAIDAKAAFAAYFAGIQAEIETLNAEQNQKHQAHMRVTPRHLQTMERMNRYIAEEKSKDTPDVEQLAWKLKTVGFIDDLKPLVDDYHAWQERVTEAELTSKTIDTLQKELSGIKRKVFAWQDYLADTIKADFYPPNYLVFFVRQSWNRMLTGSAEAAGQAQLNASSYQHRAGEESTNRWVVGHTNKEWDPNAQDDMAGSTHAMTASSSTTRRTVGVDDDNPPE